MIKKIGIKNVNFGFNREDFFKNLSITFSTKGISVIIGPNGSGKSLITKLLKGIILPNSGEIQLVSDKITPKISYLSQKITFPPNCSTTFAVDIHAKAGTITSSPFLKSKAIRASIIANCAKRYRR